MPLSRQETLATLIAEHKKTNINNLPTDLQVLFGLLKLAVDIRFRNKYDNSLDNQRDDRQSLSIEKQDKQVRTIVDENNFLPIQMPPEECSAKVPGRPIFDDMLLRVERGEARYIVVWSLSRLSRNSVDAGKVIYLLDRGLLDGIHTPTRSYKNTPDDKTFLAIELAFAKKNNDDLSVQVKEGFDSKRSRGQYPGPAPLGFRNIIVRPGERNIAIDPETGPKCIRICEIAATGNYSVAELLDESINMGLVSRQGNILSKQTLIEMLKRRANMGYFQYGGGNWHKGTYEPLISEDLYNKIQDAMGWSGGRTAKQSIVTSGRYYPYKGILKCLTCKHNIAAYTKRKLLSNGFSAEYIFYTCTKKSKIMKCNELQISADSLEIQILDLLSQYEISESDGRECYEWLEIQYDSYIQEKQQDKPMCLKTNAKHVKH